MYQQTFSRSTPGCIVFLLDRSDSMKQMWAGSSMTLAEGAALAINNVLLELCVKSTKEAGAEMRRYFFVGCFGYGLRPNMGGEGVESALPGRLAAQGIVPLPELAKQYIAMREEPTVDAMSIPSRVPIWIEPRYGFRTPMCQAISEAGDYVYKWSKEYPTSPAPIVINASDGMWTDSPYQGADATEWARRLTTIKTTDGPTLFLNAFLSPSRAPMAFFPSHGDTLPQPGPQLFSISSPLPATMRENARSAHIEVPEGARGLVFNADLTALVKFLEIGTRFEVRHG